LETGLGSWDIGVSKYSPSHDFSAEKSLPSDFLVKKNSMPSYFSCELNSLLRLLKMVNLQYRVSSEVGCTNVLKGKSVSNFSTLMLDICKDSDIIQSVTTPFEECDANLWVVPAVIMAIICIRHWSIFIERKYFSLRKTSQGI
jgi:hypothetical protein